MEPSFDRLFTLTEANQTLEKLRPIVADLIQARARLLEMQPELAPVLQKMLGNGGSRLTAELFETFERLRADARAIEAMGVAAQGPGDRTARLPLRARRPGRFPMLAL